MNQPKKQTKKHINHPERVRIGLPLGYRKRGWAGKDRHTNTRLKRAGGYPQSILLAFLLPALSTASTPPQAIRAVHRASELKGTSERSEREPWFT